MVSHGLDLDTLQTRTGWRAPVFLVVLCLMLYLPGFVGLMPMDRDEPRFAQATKQMLETGDFVAPRFQDDARNKKPVGIYWMQAAAVQGGDWLGVPNARQQIWLYRIPSLIGALVSVLLTYRIGLMMMSRRGAFLAASLLACCIVVGVEARLAKTDSVVTASVIMSMAMIARLWQAQTSDKPLTPRTQCLLPILFWFSLAVGVLVKGPVTPLVVGLTTLLLSVRLRSWAWLKPLKPLFGSIGFFCLVLPWFVLIGLRTGGGFFSDALGGDMLQKITSGVEQHGAPPGSYLALSWLTAWPLVPFAILAAPQIWARRHEQSMVFLLTWALPSWLLFELVPTKLPHYVMPLLPALALLTGLVVEAGPLQWKAPLWRRVALLLIPVVAFLCLTGGLAAFLYFKRMPSAWLLVALCLCIILASLLWRQPTLDAVRISLFSVALSVLVTVAVYETVLTGPVAAPFYLSPRLQDLLHQAQVATGCQDLQLASVQYHEPSFVFLTRTDLADVDAVGGAKFLSSQPCRGLVIPSLFKDAFLKSLAPSGSLPTGIAFVGDVTGINLNKVNQPNQGFVTLNVYVRGPMP